MNRKITSFKTTLLALCLACCTGAWAQQAYPTKPLKIVVPFGAGGVADLTARTVAQKMSENMGQSIVIENKPGAGGVVATDAVAKSAADGYTLLLMSNATAVSAGLFKSLPYDAEKDLTPLSVLGTFDIAIVVPQESKFASLADVLNYAKANPGKLNIGSINVGSTQHLAAELFKSTAGIDAQVVPFNGTPAVLTALRGGQIEVGVEILAPVLPQIKGQALRALAVRLANSDWREARSFAGLDVSPRMRRTSSKIESVTDCQASFNCLAAAAASSAARFAASCSSICFWIAALAS